MNEFLLCVHWFPEHLFKIWAKLLRFLKFRTFCRMISCEWLPNWKLIPPVTQLIACIAVESTGIRAYQSYSKYIEVHNTWHRLLEIVPGRKVVSQPMWIEFATSYHCGSGNNKWTNILPPKLFTSRSSFHVSKCWMQVLFFEGCI